nr:DUF4832 domain-containing protein [Eubacterium sp.]
MIRFRHKPFPWVAVLLLFILAFGLISFVTKTKFSYKSTPLNESNTFVQNPYCGFFHLYGYTLSEASRTDADIWCRQMLENDTQSLVLLQINLKNYSNKDISSNALQQLDHILATFASADKQLILRFLYDWDGKALETEPREITQLMAHMDQVASVVNRHVGHIFSLQGVFTGNCGEMNQTNYGTNEHIQILMKKLADVIDPNIFLAVRTPSHLRAITGQKNPLSNNESYTGTLPSRLGLYNDGMMGNVLDCGTYDDTSYSSSTDLSEKGTREEELNFQNQLCRYVPNGGEVIIENSYNDFPQAAQDLATMHVSYLSCDYDGKVLNKWKSTIYRGEDADIFNGCTGYEYVEAHLGYRFVVTSSSLQKDQLFLSFSNTGFAPSYRTFDTTLQLTHTETMETTSHPVELDTRRIMPEREGMETSIKLPKLSKGEYKISLQMYDPATKLPIHFANKEATSDGSLPLGTLTIH